MDQMKSTETGSEAVLRIGEVARASGVSVRMLRHYDETGLLTPTWHTDGGHREYSVDDVLRLETIVTLRSLGLSLAEVRTLLDGKGDPAVLLEQQVAALDQTLATLQTARARLVVLRHRLARAEAPTLDELLDLAAMMAQTPTLGPSESVEARVLARREFLDGLTDQERETLLASRSALAQALGQEGLAALGRSPERHDGDARVER